MDDFLLSSFCNQNSLMSEQSVQFGKDILASNYLTDVFSQLYIGNDIVTIQFARYIINTNLMNPALNDTFRKLMGSSLEDTLISCNYALAPCSSSDFEWYYDIIYGIY
jgi:hypothetical protein